MHHKHIAAKVCLYEAQLQTNLIKNTNDIEIMLNSYIALIHNLYVHF